MPVSRTVIADLENGRRRYVTTAELASLAYALLVNPIDLLYPDGDDDVETIAGHRMTRTAAVEHFTGIQDEEKLDRLLKKSNELREKLREAAQLAATLTVDADTSAAAEVTRSD